MQNIFVTADTHFDHANIIKYCDRPFANVHEMNEVLMNNWNAVVQSRDLVYIVGDFAWKARHRYWAGMLNGRKTFIRGSHDAVGIVEPCFESVHDILDTKISGQKVTFCHYPMLSWRASFHGSWHLYGHTHGRILELKDKLTFDVGVDVWDYRPIPWKVVQLKMFNHLTKDHTNLDQHVETLRKANIKLLNDYYTN